MKQLALIVALLTPLWPSAQVTFKINQTSNKGLVIAYWEDFQFQQDTILKNTSDHQIGTSSLVFFRVEALEPEAATPFLVGFSGDTVTIDLHQKTISIGGGNSRYNQFVQEINGVLSTTLAGRTPDEKLQFVMNRSSHFFDSYNHEQKDKLKTLYELTAVTNMELYPFLVKYAGDYSKIDSLAMFIKRQYEPDAIYGSWARYLDRVTPVHAAIAEVNLPELTMMNNLVRILRMHAVQRDSTLEQLDEYQIENNIIKDLFPESPYRTRLMAYNLFFRIDNYIKYPTLLAGADRFIEALEKEDSSTAFMPEIQTLYSKQLANIGTLAKGAAAPAFNLPDEAGKIVSLKDFRGKVVYIDIWATWCGPCLKEMPYLKELSQKFDSNEVAFVSISIDTKLDRWQSMITKLQLEGTQLIDSIGSQNSKIASDYKVYGVPHYILIDKKGKIASAYAPPPSFGKAIEEEIRSLLK